MKILPLILMALCVSCTNAQNNTVATSYMMQTDTLPPIRHINEMKALNDTLYIVYETESSAGQRFLCSYFIDLEKGSLSFNGNYGERDGGYWQSYMPYPFVENNRIAVASQDECDLFSTNPDRTLASKRMYLLGGNAEPPYPLSQYVQDVFSDDEIYYFVSRQPMGGQQALFALNPDSTSMAEIRPLVFDSQYPSWAANAGELAYSPTAKHFAFSYRLYPIIEFYDIDGNAVSTISITDNTFDPETLDEADMETLNPIHFVDVTQSNNNLYALYWGKTYSDMSTEGASSTIYKLDWNGNILHQFNVDMPLYRIAYITDNTLIGWDGKNLRAIQLLD